MAFINVENVKNKNILSKFCRFASWPLDLPWSSPALCRGLCCGILEQFKQGLREKFGTKVKAIYFWVHSRHMFSICGAMLPAVFLRMSRRLLFHYRAVLAPVAKQTVVHCERGTNRAVNQRSEGAGWCIANFSKWSLMYMIPVINEHGAQRFAAAEVEEYLFHIHPNWD